MYTRSFSGFVLSILLIILMFTNSVYGENARINPSREELEKKIEDVARRKGIPSVILKSIARVESVFQQYRTDGSVYTGRSGSIGLMQIHNIYGMFDNNRLKYDIDYNIEAGADVLLMKWKTANEKLPKIGDMNPNVLENWYFALWAYNSWVESNNPNMIPYRYRTRTKKYTYQQLIYMVAEKEYRQKITPIDPRLLPKKGLPSKDQVFNTPADFHYGDIVMYQKGDIVKVNVKKSLILRDNPNGNEIERFSPGIILDVLDGPELKNGYFWYKVKAREGSKEGWVAGNWVIKIGDNERGIYPLNDIKDSWAIDYIVDLYNQGVINGDDNKNFYPNNFVTREEMSAFICKVMGINDSDFELTYGDIDQISPWAIPYVKAVSKAGLMTNIDDINFRPKKYLNREEAAEIIVRLLKVQETENEVQFTDATDISPWAVEAVKIVCEKGIMTGKGEGLFKPKDNLTRAEVSKIISTVKTIENEEKTIDNGQLTVDNEEQEIDDEEEIENEGQETIEN